MEPPTGARVLAAYGDWERLLKRHKLDAMRTIFDEQGRKQEEFRKSPEGRRLLRSFRRCLSEERKGKDAASMKCEECGYATREHEDVCLALREFIVHKCKGKDGYGGQEEAR
jgi:hypothetical protein